MSRWSFVVCFYTNSFFYFVDTIVRLFLFTMFYRPCMAYLWVNVGESLRAREARDVRMIPVSFEVPLRLSNVQALGCADKRCLQGPTLNRSIRQCIWDKAEDAYAFFSLTHADSLSLSFCWRVFFAAPVLFVGSSSKGSKDPHIRILFYLFRNSSARVDIITKT